MWIIIKIMSKNQSGLFFWVKKKWDNFLYTKVGGYLVIENCPVIILNSFIIHKLCGW